MSRLKTSFEKANVIAPLYTGGPVALTADEEHIITCVGEQALLTRLSDGEQLGRFSCDGEAIHSLCLTPSSSHLAIFTASLSLFIFDGPLSVSTAASIRPFRIIHRAHDAPVHVCKVDPTSTLLASGSADGVVKVWDITRGYTTHVFKGHGGVVSALAFRYVRDSSSAIMVDPIMQLVTASVDTQLRIFDLSSAAGRSGRGKSIAVLEGHVSVPRGLDISADCNWLISGGRDAVVLVWNLGSLRKPSGSDSKTKGAEQEGIRLHRTIPILERVEAVGFLDNVEEEGTLAFFTAGEKGIIKVWDAHSGVHIYSLDQRVMGPHVEMEEQLEILSAWYQPRSSNIVSVHADQNILVHSTSERALSKQLIGFNDEIVDITYLSGSSEDSNIAIAANSSLIRVYSTKEYDARLLAGHSNVVLSLDRSVRGRILASGGKDKSARIWAFAAKKQSWSCIAVCEGHSESIGAVSLSRKSTAQEDEDRPSFLITGSQDRTIKMWDLSSAWVDVDGDTGSVPVRCKSLTTLKAHEKDINSLDISPNDQLLASGSQDRTAKVYTIQYQKTSAGVRGEMKLVGICKGHKRGVWTVKFGASERVLATGGGDKTIKLWNLDDFTCVKTLQGHTNSVLRVVFLSQDCQLASSSSDGLVKLWNVRSEECVSTLDNHEEKVWALTINREETTIVSGGADSVVTFWRDCTLENERAKEENRSQQISKEQDLLNYLIVKDYRNAISVALALDQPGRLLTILRRILFPPDEHSHWDPSHNDGITKYAAADQVLLTLGANELASLIRHIRDWNANAKTSVIAQTLLHTLFKLHVATDMSNKCSLAPPFSDASRNVKNDALPFSEVLQSLIPYTERHLARTSRLIQDSYILDYVLGEMDEGILADEDK